MAIIIEEKGDLFDVGDEYSLAHCISLDCAMGAGIAKTFCEKYPDMKHDLQTIVKRNFNTIIHPTILGWNIHDNDNMIFNLVTKRFYYDKPTYDDMKTILYYMKQVCDDKNITKLAIPRIGCGLDGLSWNKVKVMISDAFEDVDITILVRYM